MVMSPHSLSDLVVLRGGSEDFVTSLEEGQEVLRSLSRIGYYPVDVLIDRDGQWTTQGVPTDMHQVFTCVHTVIDTTRMRNAPHHDLAKRMGISFLFSPMNASIHDRENVYRLLRMQGVLVPDTIVVRASQPLADELLHHIWSTCHTPLLVRPLSRRSDAPSQLLSSYFALEQTLHDFHRRGVDVHVMTYRKLPTITMAVLPNYRGERVYTPLMLETVESERELPHDPNLTRAYVHARDWMKKEVKEITTRVYDALHLHGPALVDLVYTPRGYLVVHVEERPTLTKHGRFMQALETTGIEIGQFFHSQMEQEAGYETDTVQSPYLSSVYDEAR